MKKRIVWACLAGMLSGSVLGGSLHVNFSDHATSCVITYQATDVAGLIATTNVSGSGVVNEFVISDTEITVSNVVVSPGYFPVVSALDTDWWSETVTNTLSGSTTGSYSHTPSIGGWEKSEIVIQTVLITNTIGYVTNGGTLPDGSPTAYTIESPDLVLPTPTLFAHDFGGWYTNSAFLGEAFVSIPSGSLGDRMFYARWTPSVYSVTLHLNGGWIVVNGEQVSSPTFVTNYAYGSGLSLPTVKKTGYRRGSWHPDEDCIESAVSSIGTYETGSREFWANFTERVSYKITLDNQGADISGTKVVDVAYDSVPSAIFCPTRYGYDFQGYFSQPGGGGSQYYKPDGQPLGYTWETAGDGTIYAYWIPHAYTVSFDAGGGVGEMASMALTYGVETNLPPVEFSKKGHVFNVWKTNLTAGVAFADGQAVSNLTIEANGVVTMTATWSAGHYFVAFDKNASDAEGEMAVQDLEYDRGVALDANAFTRPGCSFAGWAWNNPAATTNDIDFVDGQVVTNLIDVFDSGLGSTNTLYAVWKAEEYEVSLDANAAKGGYFLSGDVTSESITATVVYGGDYGSLPMPSNELAQMSFAGWKYVDGVTGTTNSLPSTVPLRVAGVTNLVAQWRDGLAAALNADKTDFEYKTGGYRGGRNTAYDARWIPRSPAGDESAGQSGDLPANDSGLYGSYLQTVLPGAGVLTYRWRIIAPVGYYRELTETFYGNRIRFVDVDTNEELVLYLATGDDKNSTEWVDSGWRNVAFTNNSENPLTVEWRFETQFGQGQLGGGTGWVDNVTWTPAGGLQPGKEPVGPNGSSPMTIGNGQTSVCVANTVQGWWYGLYSKTNLADSAEQWTILPSTVEYPAAKQATGDDVPISFAWPWNLQPAPQRFFKIFLSEKDPRP